jgi:hypothetical protein
MPSGSRRTGTGSPPAEAVKWERRRQEAIERDWGRAQDLWSKAEAVLDAPCPGSGPRAT